MKASRVVMLVIGSLLALVGVGLLIGAATLGWALAAQRDESGFFSTETERFETEHYAITSDRVDLGSEGGADEWWSDRELATVRVRVDGAGERAVFVGIAHDADLEAYLADVPYARVDDVDLHPFSAEYVTENPNGAATPDPPGDQDIWVASATGPGTQTLTWDLEPGEWALVVMNADGSQGVATDVEVGIKIDYLVPIAIGLAVGGLLLLGGGAALIVGAVASGRTGAETGVPGAMAPSPLQPAVATTARRSPVWLSGRLDPGLSRWMWLVKWFLAIPHLIVLVFLWIAFWVLTVIAFFAILFTGRYPRSMFDFNVGVLRWTWRVDYYGYGVLGTDQYPPFTLAAADYPATLEIAYPERLSRGLVLVKWWLLAIPHFLIVGVFTSGFGMIQWGDGWRAGASGGLLAVLVLIVAVALLFTGRYPRGLYDLIMGLNRWVLRVVAYVALMTDEYPPFRLDQGPDEPARASALPPPVAGTDRSLDPS